MVFTDTFEMTFEIDDKARGAQKIITLPSFTAWDSLKDKVTQVLNNHPGSLQLQYQFSNENSNALPFDLVLINDYNKMRDQLKPFVVPKILASGKPLKSWWWCSYLTKGKEYLPVVRKVSRWLDKFLLLQYGQLIYIYWHRRLQRLLVM